MKKILLLLPLLAPICFAQGVGTIFFQASYNIAPTAATPTFSPAAGAVASGTVITISSSTSGATLCYTTDGSTPTANGAGTCTHGTSGSSVTVSAAETIKAVASKSGYQDSGVGSAAYTILAPGIVQSCGNAPGSAGPTSISCTFGSPITAGNLLYICLFNAESTSFPITPTWSGDSGTVTVDLAPTNYNSAGGNWAGRCWYIASASGGGTTITLTSPNLTFPALIIEEARGTHTLDQSDSGAIGTGTTATSGSITTTSNGELVLGSIFGGSGNPTITAGSGYTIGALASSTWALEYQYQTTAGAITATAGFSASNSWLIHIASFKP